MTEKARRQSRLFRLASFLALMRKNKRGLVGLIIVIAYSLVALIAPILTPFDPISDQFVGGSLARPTWARFLPGGEKLSENMIPISESFDSPGVLDRWLFQTSSPGQSEVSYEQYVGRNSPGSLRLSIRPGPSGTITSSITTGFVYPYGGFPSRFIGNIAVLTSGYRNLTEVEITVSLKRADQASEFTIWGPVQVGPDLRQLQPTTWLLPTLDTNLIDSNDPKILQRFDDNPQGVIFPKQGNYLFKVEVVAQYPEQPVQGVETSVYIDDPSLTLLGTAYGLLGTEFQGRDTFAQLVYGARISLMVGLLSSALLVIIGLSVGLIAGFLGGLVDEALMRFTDMLLVIPGLPLLIVMAAVLGASIWNIILLLGLLGWTGFARVVRSQVLSLRERPFVEAAKSVGAGTFHITSRHILPNVMGLVYVSLATAVPGAIIAEAALSFLGLFDPSVMSWGRMLNDVQVHSIPYNHYWLVFPPGLSIAAVSLSFILIGYALDEHFNPKLRKRR